MILAILLISCVASFIVYHIYFLETDECESNPCLNNGTCTDLVYNYNCTCEHGYFGRNCENGMYIQTLRKACCVCLSKEITKHRKHWCFILVFTKSTRVLGKF
jgi:hypothetical protein